MLNVLSKEALQGLLKQTTGPCISLYMPAPRGSGAMPQERLRLRHLLRQAEDQLRTGGLPSLPLTACLRPGHQLLEDELFWRRQGGGLALFFAPDVFYSFQTPFALPESLTVGDHFYLRPLLPLLDYDETFYILSLSQNHVRLLRCTAQTVHEVALPPETPRSLAEALQYDEFAQQRQLYSGIAPGHGRRAGAIFFAQGVGSDVEKDNLRRYCNAVDKGVCAALHDAPAPLLLAAVDSLLPMYDAVSDYPRLTTLAIVGSPDERSAAELQARGWELVQPLLAQNRQVALGRYADLVDTGHASGALTTVLPAAYQGRIETLLVARDGPQWGTFDLASGAVQVHPQEEPGDTDLVDLAIRYTLMKRGTVATVAPESIPAHMPLAALFRY